MIWLLGLAVTALVCIAYGVLIERHAFILRRFRVPILPVNAPRTVTVLHLSDLHTVRNDGKKLRFLAGLPTADITVVTGDFLAEAEGLTNAIEGVRPARGTTASYFTLGSNDHFVSKPLNYLRYFKSYAHDRHHHSRTLAQRGPTQELIDGLIADGWIDLDNTRTTTQVGSVAFEVGGVDDAHIHRDDLSAAVRIHPEMVGLGVTHSPDPGPEMIAMGYDLVLGGHTHGGQVRAPLIGALVNNSQLPNRYSRGMYRIGRGWFHISAGLGTSKYAPFRFLCRPEASLLELTPAPESSLPPKAD